MRVGELVDDGLGNIGIITVANKDLPLPYFAQFFNTYDGGDITGWYLPDDLELVT